MIRQSLGDMANSSSQTLARMASRCYNFAQQSCVWVDAAIKLDLAHPGLERSCLDFSGMTMEDIMIVFDDPIYFDSLRFCVHSGGEMAEAIQRVNLWDKLIGHLLNTEEPDILGLKPEHGISPYLGLREGRIVDLVAVSNKFQLPILFVEASRERVLPGNQHKDFSKMATTMIQACIQNGELLNSHGCDVALAKVFGIWTGGSQARFCIAHPMKRVVGNRIEATIMFSAPDCWCFDLLRFPNGPCCGQTCCNFEGIESIPSSTCTTTIERLCAMPEFSALPLDQTAAEVALTTSNPVPIEEVNYVAAAALRYFCNQVRSHAEDLNNWDAANLPPDEPFENTVMPELHYLCAQSRVNQFGASPQKPRSGEGKDGAGSAGLIACLLANPMELGERGPYIDEDKEQYFLIKKPLRAGRELEILTAIETSVLAPTLANCVIYPEEDSCVYQFDPLEAVDAQYAPLYDFIPKNGTDLYWHILGGVTCAIHTLCGLYLLHNTYRIVHSNISRHSIMFSKSRKLWKIVGYGYAYGIDESAITPRTVGPDGYKVPEIGNRGIFTTASDVYSLGKALNDLWFGTLDHMIEYGVGERGARELFEAFYPLVVKMMAQDPAERPTVFAALSAFTSIYSEKVWPYEDFVFLSAELVFEIVTKIIYCESVRAEYARACPHNKD